MSNASNHPDECACTMCQEHDQEFEPGIDGCHHGVGWDEECEYCDDEDRAERLSEREKRKRQQSLDLGFTPSDAKES